MIICISCIHLFYAIRLYDLVASLQSYLIVSIILQADKVENVDRTPKCGIELCSIFLLGSPFRSPQLFMPLKYIRSRGDQFRPTIRFEVLPMIHVVAVMRDLFHEAGGPSCRDAGLLRFGAIARFA